MAVLCVALSSAAWLGSVAVGAASPGSDPEAFEDAGLPAAERPSGGGSQAKVKGDPAGEGLAETKVDSRLTSSGSQPMREIAPDDAGSGPSVYESTDPAPAPAMEDRESRAFLEQGVAASGAMSLSPWDIDSIKVDDVSRVAVGDPAVLDVSLVSSDEILLQAKALGTTMLIVWDKQGKRVWTVDVVDRGREATEAQLRRLLDTLSFSGVGITRDEDKVFLDGQIESQDDLTRLTRLVDAYEGKVINLATLKPAPPPPPFVPPRSVQLTVQVIEMTRDATDRFGVDWVDSLTFTETSFGALGPSSISQAARLGEAFRLGALSRGGLSATLSMLVSQGKARILAEPKLVAASGKEATSLLGVEVPVISATNVSSGTVTQNIQFKNTGVELKFKPTVLEDGRSIQVEIDAKVSSIDKNVAITVSGVTVPGFRVRQTQTEIVADTGQSIMITGLLQDEEKKNISQLPAVGSIPVLGNLFRSTEFIRGQTELIIIVTPDLSRDEGAEAADRASTPPRAADGPEPVSALKDPTLRYALQVQDRVSKSIRYPPREKELGMGGQVKLRLHLLRDGTLGQAMIAEPSGVEAFDLEALNAAQNQSPYPPFPPELPQPDLWVELPVVFRP